MKRTNMPNTAVLHAADDAPAPWADRIGRWLMAFDAVATLGALARGIQIMTDVSDERLLTEAWRTFAYVLFAGLWALVAVAPRGQRGLWELLLLHKTAVTVFALAVGHVPESSQTALVDGFLVVSTAAAYVLCRGWQAWRPAAPAPVGGAPVPARTDASATHA
ncbi:hypothetical protein BC342_03845 [Streptomyces olivaceus]|nr:hypothetical protein BC342_03845 [Streptomyces olivaceus]